MKLFYIKHHYQSIVRSTSFDGEVFAFFVLAVIFGSSMSLTYAELDNYSIETSRFFSQEQTNGLLFLMLYVFLDLGVRLVFRRPFPKLKYYMLWKSPTKQIASQYLFTSLFGIMPFIMALTMLMIAYKAIEWYSMEIAMTIFAWWLANHFLGLIAQFAHRRVKTIFAGLVALTLLVQWLIPSIEIANYVVSPIAASLALFVSGFIAYLSVKSVIEKREIHEDSSKGSFLESLPVLSFKNPVFQLEWALLVRNKRTRSNLLLGLVSVLILPFLLDENSTWMIETLIFFIITGFFIIQHGVYSLGWEGSYFDFLLTNISPKTFIKTRYVFYVGTCVVGLLLATIPTIINGLSFGNLFAVFIYNVGITVPLVLYRSTLNSTKIILTENSFMNYNGMLTGPIFVSSFLVILLPLFIYGLGQVFLGSNAIYLVGLIGIIAIFLFGPFTNLISKKYHNRKYYLSQSFKA